MSDTPLSRPLPGLGIGVSHERADLLTWLTTTDHKRIGVLYGTAALGFFIAAGPDGAA